MSVYQLVEGRHGRFLINPKDIYIGRSLALYGEFSEQEWQLLDQLVPQGGVIIEAGANIGAFTVPIASKVGMAGVVYAFEPQVLVFQQLAANLSLNGILNAQAANAACGEEARWLRMPRINPELATNFGGIALETIAGQGDTRIRQERLDEAVDPPRLDLIKADVEGMELAVLLGAAGLIARFRPRLYVEAHDPAKAPALIAHVLQLGYRAFWHLPRMFRAENHAGRAENVFGNITSKNLLCVPEEQSLTVQGAREVAGPGDHPAHWGA